ncbi:10736_t:CDS:1, partial [Paraglomus brasilianum]
RNGLVWNLNVCIMEATAADIILGTNFLIKYGAMLDLPRQQLILTKTKEYQEVISLVKKKQLQIRTVSAIEQMDIDQPQEHDAMEVDYNPKWKCSDGLKEFQCMKRFVPDDVDEDPEPCVKCHN